MKSWLFLALAGAGAYFAYDAWFAPDVPEAGPVLEGAASPAPPLPARPDKSAADRLRLDAPPEGAGGAEPDEAALLDAERRRVLQEGDADAAAALEERILSEHPDSDAARLVFFERGREALREYETLGRTPEGLARAHEARKLMTPALFLNDASRERREELRRRLAQLADDVLFEPRHVEGADFLYTPKRGDNLDTLCRKVFPSRGADLTPGFVAAVNGMASASALRAGQSLKVPLGRPELVVVKSEFRLYFLLEGAYVRDWKVGLGKDGKTPVAEFVVHEKIKDPDWYHPETNEKIPYGSPRNILGTRWIGFKNTEAFTGFGIHGTQDPSSIGREESSGCIRMGQAEVEQLFDWTPRGARVVIVP